MKKFIFTILTSAVIFGAPAAMAYGDKTKDYKKSYEKQVKADIVDTAAGNDDFSTLVAAVQAAGLVEALKSEGPFTVFAPTNKAFAALPEGTLDSLLQPENKDQLAAILKYHVVSGKIKAKSIADGTSTVETLEGGSFEVVKSENGVTVDGANVTATDIKTSNGIIHVLDAVILPE